MSGWFSSWAAVPASAIDLRTPLAALETQGGVRELALELHPVAEVSEDAHRGHLPGALVEDGAGHVHRNALPGLGDDLLPGEREPPRAAVLGRSHPLQQLGADAFADEEVRRAEARERVLGAVPGEGLGSLVEEDEVPPHVHGHHRVHGVVHQLLEELLGPPQLVLDPARLGDVAEAEDGGGVALAQGRSTHRQGELAVRGRAGQHIDVALHLAPGHRAEEGGERLGSERTGEVLHVAALELPGIHVEHPGAGGVQEQHRSRPVEDGDSLGDVGEEGLVALELLRSPLGDEASGLLPLGLAAHALEQTRVPQRDRGGVGHRREEVHLGGGEGWTLARASDQEHTQHLPLNAQGERGDGTHAGGRDALVHSLEERMARDVLHDRGQAGAQALADLGVAVHLDSQILDVGRVARRDHHRRARAVVEEQAGPGNVQHLREAPGDVVQERVHVGRLGVPCGELEQRFQTSLLAAGLDLERVTLAGLLQAPAELGLQLAHGEERVGGHAHHRATPEHGLVHHREHRLLRGDRRDAPECVVAQRGGEVHQDVAGLGKLTGGPERDIASEQGCCHPIPETGAVRQEDQARTRRHRHPPGC